jgi:hypothetical protein
MRTAHALILLIARLAISPFLDKRVRFSGYATAVRCGMLLQPKVWITLLRRKKLGAQPFF